MYIIKIISEHVSFIHVIYAKDNIFLVSFSLTSGDVEKGRLRSLINTANSARGSSRGFLCFDNTSYRSMSALELRRFVALLIAV